MMNIHLTEIEKINLRVVESYQIKASNSTKVDLRGAKRYKMKLPCFTFRYLYIIIDKILYAIALFYLDTSQTYKLCLDSLLGVTNMLSYTRISY